MEELFRSLASLIEPPGEETSRLSRLLDLESAPEVSDQTDLFLFQVYPYASVYLDNRGQLGGEARDRIAGFWRALELVPPSEPDHLTVLLAFYSQLREQESTEGGSAGNRWRHVRAAFLWEHLLSWLPFYLDKVRHLDYPFYTEWADLLTQALSEEVSELPPPEQLPLHLREASPFFDPREKEDTDFLDTLLSPVRSGIILVRNDLFRAGRELQLGIRAGERRYVLKALLGHDDKATLQWLSSEAARWAESHASWAPILGPIATYWSSRASSTAELLADLAKDL